MASSLIIASLEESARWVTFRTACEAHLAHRAAATVRRPAPPTGCGS